MSSFLGGMEDKFVFWDTMPLMGKIHLAAAVFFSFTGMFTLVVIVLHIAKKNIPSTGILHLKGFILGLLITFSFLMQQQTKKKAHLFLMPVFLTIFFVLNLIPITPLREKAAFACISTTLTTIFIFLTIGFTLFLAFIKREGATHFKLQAEVRLAREIHGVLVPGISYSGPFCRVEGISIPIGEMGGDMIDVTENDSGTTCIIADVSGHGVAAGIVMAAFKSITHTLSPNVTSLAGMFNQLNRVIYSMKKKDMFVTAAALRLMENRRAEFIVAGHLPILHLDSQTGEINHLLIKQLAPGILREYDYRSEIITYNPGDLFVFLTDGLTETLTGDDRQLGLAPLEQTVKAHAHCPPQEIQQALLNTAQSFGAPHDDQSILIIKAGGPAPLDAPRRLAEYREVTPKP